MRKDFIPFSLGLLYQVLLLILDSVFLLLYRGPQRQENCQRKSVLLIRLDAIGDFFLWLGSVRALRELYPSELYDLTLLGNSLWAELAEDLGVFDHVWSLDKKSFFDRPLYRLRMLKTVRAARFDMAAHLVYSREFSYGDSLVRATGAQERVGFRGDITNTSVSAKRISDRWYTKLFEVKEGEQMEFVRNAEFIRALGYTDFEPCFPSMEVHYPLPQGFRIEDYCVIVPGAGAQHRQWSLENFAQVAQLIKNHFELKIVICGAHSEAKLGEGLMASLPGVFCNWTGKTSLRELVAIISSAKFVVSNETSAVHIAAAVGTPSVCIQGGGHFGRFLPYVVTGPGPGDAPLPVSVHMDCFNCNWQCRFVVPKGHPAPCIEKVKVDSVWKAIEKVMQRV